MNGRKEEDGVIIEYTLLGNFMKVTAMDTATLREVSIVGSPRVSRRELADLAVRKLRYVQHKDKR